MDEFIFCFGGMFFIISACYVEERVFLQYINKIFVGEVLGEYRFVCEKRDSYFYRCRDFLFYEERKFFEKFYKKVFCRFKAPGEDEGECGEILRML
ncbi:MAG: hypothetical protein ACRC28_08670 [Clostridium sp.]|uniref:hypothetical protein n=1 Tax=Clostridium sp. TaxID=1506 RepID=UPI003F30FA64